MPVSRKEKEFVSHIVDMMQSIGPVHAKAMFGGYGIYLEGVMFALIADSVLYLKADQVSENVFKDKGLQAFNYFKNGKACKMSYYQAPEETLEDIEQMNDWANRAYEVALSAAVKKRKK